MTAWMKWALGMGAVALASGVGVQAQGTIAPVAAAAKPQAVATLAIDMTQPMAQVSPTLYGLMTEEINYSYEGGLYGELVQDKTFQGNRNDPENWVPVEQGTARGIVTRDANTGPSVALPGSEKITVTQADAENAYGLRNRGWWGVPLRANTTYTASVYAKADKAAMGEGLRVSLIANYTGKVLATSKLSALSADWKQYSFSLKTGADVAPTADNYIVVSMDRPGTVWLQLLSVFPPTYKNRTNGNRVDLMQMMAAMHPQFLRFPGGNYLEGDHINERFDWKKTIGPLVDRPGHRSPWNYWSSDGMGLLEFLDWCEDLKMQPVLAVYAGYSLKQEVVKPGATLEPYVQDALDEIQYVTGDVSTKWGAERAKDGHPEPFALKYVEIGNEDMFDQSHSYDGRYTQFYKAIKAKYPALQLISTANSRGNEVKSVKPDVIDDHYYRRAEQFFSDVHHYDAIDRNGPKIFVGEWATREGNPTPNMGAALGDAAWMTGMERNSDLIVLSSYAPLLVNVNPGGMQWQSDLIGYDANSAYGSPSYYAQMMFASHIGTEILTADLQGAGDRIFTSATRNAAKGVVYLKLVNASSAAQTVKVSLTGASSVKATAKLTSLSAATTAASNSITEPRRVVPVESVVKVGKEFTRTVPGYAVEVLEIEAR
jgi:alpha-N-arabinofuranosidase